MCGRVISALYIFFSRKKHYTPLVWKLCFCQTQIFCIVHEINVTDTVNDGDLLSMPSYEWPPHCKEAAFSGFTVSSLVALVSLFTDLVALYLIQFKITFFCILYLFCPRALLHLLLEAVLFKDFYLKVSKPCVLFTPEPLFLVSIFVRKITKALVDLLKLGRRTVPECSKLVMVSVMRLND